MKILPFIGYIGSLRAGQHWNLSIEELSRLVGVDPKTCAKARDALRRQRLAFTRPVLHNGQSVTRWTVTDGVAAPSGETECFYFPLKLLFGGNWREMSPTQCAVYIAAATRAKVFTYSPEENWLLYGRDMLDRVDWDDLTQSFEAGDGDGSFRVSRISKAELGRITGYSAGAIDSAVSAFKPPMVWRDGSEDALWRWERRPLWVYPVARGSLLYHFRNHCKPADPSLDEDSDTDCDGFDEFHGWRLPEDYVNKSDNAANAFDDADGEWRIGLETVPKEASRETDDDDLPF